MSRKGQSKMLWIAAMAILILVFMWVFFDISVLRLVGLANDIEKCPAYCSYSCNEFGGTSTRWTPGDDYCSVGLWDVSEFQSAADGGSNPIKNYQSNAEGANPLSMPGQTIGLRCCTVLPNKKAPDYFLDPQKYRVGEAELDDDGNVVLQKRPRIFLYYKEDRTPIYSGSSRTVFSNTDIELGAGSEYTLFMQTPHLFATLGLPDQNRLIGGNNREKMHYKQVTARIVDKDGNEISNVVKQGTIQDLADAAGGKQDAPEFSVNLGSEYEGQELRLQIEIFNANAERYSPANISDARFELKMRVENPIALTGLTSEWKDKIKIGVRCIDDDVKCTRFRWNKVQWPENQQNAPPCEVNDQDPEIIYTKETQDEVEGYFEIAEHGRWVVCVEATTTGDKIKRTTKIPVQIDSTPPRIDASFNPLTGRTDAVCSDSDSGCATAIGWYYPTHPFDFIGAFLLGGGGSYCPQEKAPYRMQRADRLPEDPKSTTTYFGYPGSETFYVFCMIAVDEAGNEGFDTQIVYNSFQALMLIAEDQRAHGGPGTGYYGYTYG